MVRVNPIQPRTNHLSPASVLWLIKVNVLQMLRNSIIFCTKVP